MKYYLIAGEASGDLHASHLMASLLRQDSDASFRFFGGDLMSAVGRGTRVKHYRELAYMGFIPVLLHLPTILDNMKKCKQDILSWQPDVVILVDYPGFNLSIAKFVKSHTQIPVYYYISPKIWAWKEYRIKNIKRDVDEMFSILPFEIPFFEQKHHYPIHYVGNPTVDEVTTFLSSPHEGNEWQSGKPIIALLAGSRKQEIKDNLPSMIEAARCYTDRYELVLAGAPGIPRDYYEPFVSGQPVRVVYEQTYPLLAHATAALVTSGTATLETALFGVPQVVCYKTVLPNFISFMRRYVLKVKYVSLVNLIADREVVQELVAATFSVENIRKELGAILPGGEQRQMMLDGYQDVKQRLGNQKAPEEAARIICKLLKHA
jgi:lipid-A-disaccharide synthase